MRGSVVWSCLNKDLGWCSRFDLERTDTYDTRPMSADRSKLRDVSILADEGAVVPVEIPVRELSRLLPELAAESGVARGELRFGREQGHPAVDVSLEATLTLRCQRCMRPMEQHVVAQSRVCLLPDEQSASLVPPEVETMLAPDGRTSVADIVGEELMLALPLAPRHDDEAECDSEIAPSAAVEPTLEDEPRRPFAALAQLMGREPVSGSENDSAERPAEAPRTRR
jgi:uncharacterized protein